MYLLIIRLIYLVFVAFYALSFIIIARDLFLGRNQRLLTVSAFGILITILVFLLATPTLPQVILPLILMISVPIYISDKNRNWDLLDQIFRITSIFAILGSAFMMINQVLR